jgi:hypothetical protein
MSVKCTNILLTYHLGLLILPPSKDIDLLALFYQQFRLGGCILAKRKSTGIPGLSFSWKRALGISQAQARLSRKIGIPLSKSGRQRKIGAAAGCLLPTIVVVVIVIMSGIALARMFR